MRIALGLYRGNQAPLPRDPTGEQWPRTWLFEDHFDVVYDERILPASGGLPPWWRLAREIERRRDEYDAVVTWSERLSLALLARQTGRAHKPHVPMLYWFSKPNVRLPMRLFGGSASGVVTWSSVQRRWAIEHLGLPPERVRLIKYFADQHFWSPRAVESDTIAAAGSEMRDYATLLEALRGTDVPCHIASTGVRINRGLLRHRNLTPKDLAGLAGPGVTVAPLAPPALRDLYARSRFVVVPVLPSDTDNGVTVILEAMSMGKAVICTRTVGQVDVVRDGVTGLFVPPRDPRALREAILSLWNDPARAQAMGEAGRQHVLQEHSLEGFAQAVRQNVEELAVGAPVQLRLFA